MAQASTTLGRAALYAAILDGRAGSPLPTAGGATAVERRAEDCAPYLENARRELAAAKKLINDCGYHRRLRLPSPRRRTRRRQARHSWSATINPIKV